MRILCREPSIRSRIVPSPVLAIQCSNAPMLQCSNVPMFQCSKAPKLQCSNAPMLQCSNAPMLQCSNVPMLQCSNAPMLECSNSPLLFFSPKFRIIEGYTDFEHRISNVFSTIPRNNPPLRRSQAAAGNLVRRTRLRLPPDDAAQEVSLRNLHNGSESKGPVLYPPPAR